MAQWEEAEETFLRDIETGNDPFKLFQSEGQGYVEVSVLNKGRE